MLILYGEKEDDEKEVTYLLEQYPSVIAKKIPSLRKKINFLHDWKAYKAIRKEIVQSNCDIVHTHGSKSGLLGRLAARNAGVGCIVHTYHGHIFHSYYNKLYSKIIIQSEKFLGKLTSRIIAISEQQRNELSETYKIADAKKITVINLGIDANLFLCTQEEQTIRTKFQIPNATVLIGIIGRIVAIKNFDLFIEIVQRVLVSEKADVQFFIIGDGNLKNKVQEDLTVNNISWCDIWQYNPAAKIIFTSWVTDIAAVLKELDIVMLTSSNEGTPLSLIEAQFFGKPVVATDAGGVKDTFIDSETGFLIPQNDPGEFVRKLSLLINDKQLRQSMGNKAITFAKEKFSKQKEVEQIKALYNDCNINS